MALTRSRVKEILSTAGVDGDSMDTAVQAIIDGKLLRIYFSYYKSDII